MAYVWGDPAEYDSWEQTFGIKGWDFQTLLPYFGKIENNPYSRNPLRGRSGPIRITDRAARDPDRISDAYIAACRQAGIAPTEDYNAVSYEGVRYLEQSAHAGRRCSAAVGYLRPARQRANLVVRTRAFVRRLRFDGLRCTGVEYDWNGAIRAASAHRETVLCAGAV